MYEDKETRGKRRRRRRKRSRMRRKRKSRRNGRRNSKRSVGKERGVVLRKGMSSYRASSSHSGKGGYVIISLV